MRPGYYRRTTGGGCAHARKDNNLRQHGRTEYTLRDHAEQAPSQRFTKSVSSINAEERNTRPALPTRMRAHKRAKSQDQGDFLCI